MPETKQELKRRLGLANKEISKLRAQLNRTAQQKEGEPQTTDETHTATKQKILAEPSKSGKFVWWLSGVGIGCLANYISSSPSILYFSCFTFAILLLWLAWRKSRVHRTISVFASLGLFFCVHKYVVHIFKESESLAAQNSEFQSSMGNGVKTIETTLTNKNPGSLSDALQQILENSKKLIAERNAGQPRIITADQRKNFITILASTNCSKISIPVIVGNNDTETEHFAEQMREMLNAAGYGNDAPKSLPAPSESRIYTASEAVGLIPPYGQVDENSIISIPGVFPRASVENGSMPPKEPDVFAVVSHPDILNSKTNPPFTPSFMIFTATKNNPNGGELMAFHPTNDPDEIIIGICNALVKEGISVGFMPANGKLPIGIFIPQKKI
jgi:hypothetical protein